jgi:hypothetical protein
MMKLVVDNDRIAIGPFRPGSRVKIKLLHGDSNFLLGTVVWTDGREGRVKWDNGAIQTVSTRQIQRA